MNAQSLFDAATPTLIRIIRRRKGWTQARLAEELGYGKGGGNKISEMERGKRTATGPIRQALVKLIQED